MVTVTPWWRYTAFGALCAHYGERVRGVDLLHLKKEGFYVTDM